MTEPYDPGHDLHLMWEAFERIRDHGSMHEHDIHGRYGLDNLASHIKRWIEERYRARAVVFEEAAE